MIDSILPSCHQRVVSVLSGRIRPHSSALKYTPEIINTRKMFPFLPGSPFLLAPSLPHPNLSPLPYTSPIPTPIYPSFYHYTVHILNPMALPLTSRLYSTLKPNPTVLPPTLRPTRTQRPYP